MNRGELREFFKDTLNRTDCTDAQANRFLDMGARRAQRVLRIPSMEQTAEITVANPFDGFDIPANFMEPKEFYAATQPLRKVTLSQFLETPEGGSPYIYTRFSSDFRVKGTPAVGTKLTLVYWGTLPDLTSDADENALAAIAPDVIVYGALTFASRHFLDDRKQDFDQAFTALLAELEQMSVDEAMKGDIAVGSPTDLEF